MIVMKFGGTSVGSPEAIERACSIIAGHRHRVPLVVVSALGNTTDRLVESAAGGRAGLRQLDDLRQWTTAVGQKVLTGAAARSFAGYLNKVLQEAEDLITDSQGGEPFGPASAAVDAILGIGERISSRLLASALVERGMVASRLDSRELFVTEAQHGGARALHQPTRDRLRQVVPPLLAKGCIPVMGGFIATGVDGSPTNLGRGGSDYSASLAGAALCAKEVQIWTDVDGVMTADPSLVRSARSLPVLSLREASELAYFGGRVLHPSTMLPAIEEGIPIRVVNSRRPDGQGTLILAEPPPADPVVKSVVYKENITLIDIYSTRMLMAHGFLARIFSVFEEHETAVDMVSTSEVSVSLTVDRPERVSGILSDLAAFSHAEASPRQAIVCVVGEGIRYTPGIAARVFNALNGIRIRMISLGASRVNVGFVVDENDLEVSVHRLHAMFFEQSASPKEQLQ